MEIEHNYEGNFDVAELHDKVTHGIESLNMMAPKLEILTLLESLEHGDLGCQTVASWLLSVISSADEKFHGFICFISQITLLSGNTFQSKCFIVCQEC